MLQFPRFALFAVTFLIGSAQCGPCSLEAPATSVVRTSPRVDAPHATHRHQRSQKAKCPQTLLASIKRHNDSWVSTPAGEIHPDVMVITCMDARIDVKAIHGDLHAYVVRVAGAGISPTIIQSARLVAKEKGVRLILVVQHSDCAAMKIAAQPPHPHYADLQQQCSEFRVGFEALSRDPELRKLDVQVQLAELNIDTHKLEFLK